MIGKRELNNFLKSFLPEYGFVKMKSSDFWGRAVNECMLQYIRIEIKSMGRKGYFCFLVRGGILSVYGQPLEKAYLESYMFGIDQLSVIYRDCYQELRRITRYDFTDETGGYTLQNIEADIKRYLLPYFNSVKTLDDYIHHCKMLKISLLMRADRGAADSLLLIKSDDHDDFHEVIEINIYFMNLWNPAPSDPEKNGYIERLKENIYKNIIIPRDKISADEISRQKAIEETERRKQINLALLKKFGLLVE